jgi:5'(3')-deoxyribonucleotidase/chloramphenicol 3-O-phosphotransferase
MQEGVYDPGILKAVFLAGGPGSGKTTVTNQLFGVAFDSFSHAGLKPANSDKFFEFLLKAKNLPTNLADLSPEEFEKITVGPQSVRVQAKELAAKNYLNYLQGRLGLLVDGTGDDAQKIVNHAKELQKNFGYDVYMVFVNTPLEKALERNDNRPRKLPHDIVTDSWNNAQIAMQEYKRFFGNNFVEISNDKDVRPGEAIDINPEIEKKVDKFVRQPIMNPVGKEWVKQALAAKKMNEATDSPYKIYCDMDGVLCDFIKQWKKFYGEDAKDAKKLDKEKFDQMLDNAPFEFWANMEWMPGSKRMWDIISKYGVTILSSPAESKASTDGKKAWIQKNIPGTPIIFEKSYNKQKHAEPDAILIDDYKRNIKQWKDKGGIEVQYLNADQVIRDLAEWGIQ